MNLNRVSWVEVSLSRLQENLDAIRQRLSPSTRVIAVVKSNAYGHGVEKVSKCLLESGVRNFAVATSAEAVELRGCVSEGSILVFGGCQEGEEAVFSRHHLTAALFDRVTSPREIPVELKIDTGMGRLGIPWEEARGFARSSSARIIGIFSHFASADEDPDFTRLQLERFEQATSGLPYPRHISNSAGLQFPEAQLDAVRLGLALYGISSCPAVDYVKPILCWKTRTLSIRSLPKGQPVGYSGSFRTSRNSQMGVLPVGYADGYRWALSNRGQVRIRGGLVPVVGRISMDLVNVDLTDISSPVLGEEVVLLEDSAESPISAASLANSLGTIPYEVLTSIGSRIERVYV